MEEVFSLRKHPSDAGMENRPFWLWQRGLTDSAPQRLLLKVFVSIATHSRIPPPSTQSSREASVLNLIKTGLPYTESSFVVHRGVRFGRERSASDGEKQGKN